MYYVTGMLNSGTSLVAGYLDHLGVDMGVDPGADDSSTPYPTIEDADLCRVTDQIVTDSGGNFLPNLYVRPGRMVAAETTLQEMRGLLGPMSGENWGFKDPYNSLTLDVWIPEIEAAGFTPTIVHVYRDPAEVIDSVLRHRAETVVGFDDLARWAEFWWRVFNQAVIDHYERRSSEIAHLFVDVGELSEGAAEFCAALDLDYRPLDDVRRPDALLSSDRIIHHGATTHIWERLKELSASQPDRAL